MRFTLKEILEFCWNNRGKNGFKHFTKEEAAATIVSAANYNNLDTFYDDNGICGAIIYTANAADRFVYVHHIFAIRGGFRSMIQEAFQRYPGYSVVGLRRQKDRTYNQRNLKYG